MRVTRQRLIDTAKAVIKNREETATKMSLSVNYIEGVREGISEYLGALLQEGVPELLQEIIQ